MEKPIERIVDAYVRLNNRRALEDLMAHRRKLAVNLAGQGDREFRLALKQIDDEIAVIEAGLQSLNAVSPSE